MSRLLPLEDFVAGIRSGNRAILARAITLIESNSPKHQQLAQHIIREILPFTGKATRLGISGVPGVGKSTFIETLGMQLVNSHHKPAVLAIDPSSARTGGSILGDKTRMQNLSTQENAFVRPSPSSCTLGGVAAKTRESMLLCEAAGYDVIIIETVGVGQSETVVADMVDSFLVLMLPGAGDELQGIKRGLLEVADILAVNKADGNNATAAELAATQYRNALHIMNSGHTHWDVPVVTCSAVAEPGIEHVWENVCKHRDAMDANGQLQQRRASQQERWMWALIHDTLTHHFETHPDVTTQLSTINHSLRDGTLTATQAATNLLQAYGIS